MSAEKVKKNNSPEILDHDLNQYFPELLKFNSLEETEKSAVYQKIKPTVERILNAIVVENFAKQSEPSALADGSTSATQSVIENSINKPEPPANAGGSDYVRVVAWNIERGSIFEGIADALENHPELKDKDLYLLTELDYGMARSGNRFVAQELAKKLNLNYAFAPVYIALQKGSGVESDSKGENTKSIHGLAIFSKYPLKNLNTVALPNGKDKMHGKEKRLGYLRALDRRCRTSGGRISRRLRSFRCALFAQTSPIANEIDSRTSENFARTSDRYRRRLEHDDLQRAERDPRDYGFLASRCDGC